MIFEQDPPYMLMATMDALIDISNWYASLSNTFIRMYDTENPSHVIPKFSFNVLAM